MPSNGVPGKGLGWERITSWEEEDQDRDQE